MNSPLEDVLTPLFVTAAVSVAVTLLLLRVDVAAYVARVETLGVGRHDAQTVPEPTLAA